MHTSFLGIFGRSAIGDALGLGFAGLKPESVSALHGEVKGYIDPSGHSADHPRRWCKKGFYSCLTQLNLLIADCLLETGKFEVNFRRKLEEAAQPDIPGFKGVFRNIPQAAMALFEPDRDRTGKPAVPLALFSGLGHPFLLKYPDDPKRVDDEIVRFILGFNRHYLTSASALMIVTAFLECLDNAGTPAVEILRKTAGRLQEKEGLMRQNFSGEFDLLSLSCAGWMSSTVKGLAERDLSDRAGTLDWIVRNCRDRTGLEVSRPGHNHPLAVCVLGLYAGIAIRDWPDSVFFTAGQAGESQVSSAIAGALSGVLSDEDIHLTEPKELLTGLANYRQVLLRAENIAEGSVSSKTRPFRQMEHDLTLSVSLDFNRFLKDHPRADRPVKKPPIEAAPIPMIPDRKNKRKWREYVREKSKEKRRRRR